MERCWRRTGSPGNSGLPPLALDPPAHGASLPAALGLPGPGVPAEEADREGGLLHRGVQDPAGPRVRHGVPGKRWVRGELWGGLGCAVSRRMPACFSITSPSLFHLFPSITSPSLSRGPPALEGSGGAHCSPSGFRSSSPALPAPGAFLGSAWNVLSTNAAGKPPLVGMECWDTLSAAGGCIPTFPWIPSFGRGAVPGADPG